MVHGLLTDLIKGYKYAYTDKHGEERETYTLVDLDGVKGENVGNAGGEGHIPYVELVKPPDIEGLDTEGLAVPREQRMKVTIKAAQADAVSFVNKIKTWAFNHDWTDVRVEIDFPDDQSRTRVDVARGRCG